MRSKRRIIAVVLATFGGAMGQPAPGDNRAYVEAQKRPAFDIRSPVGLTADAAEKQRQRDAGQVLRQRLSDAIRDGKKLLTIAPGDYRFADMKPLRLEGAQDLTIDAAGATFWFERSMKDVAGNPPGLQFEKCRRVTLRGARIDFDPPLYIQARILRVHADEKWFEVEVPEGFPVVDRLASGQMTAYRQDGRFTPQAVLTHNGVTRLADRRLRVDWPDSVGRVIEGPHHRALAEAWGGQCLIRPGDWLAIIFRRGNSVQIEQCEQMLLEDVDIYASPGMGILESGGPGGHTYRRIRLIRKPGTCRLHVGMADALHSRLLAKGPTIEQCEFSFNSDDMVNLHGFFALACHRLSPRKFVLRAMDYDPFRLGGRVASWDFSSVESHGSALITAIEPLADAELARRVDELPGKMHILGYRSRPVVVTLDRDVTAEAGAMVDTFTDHDAGFVIRDCYFHDSMGRALLINGASDGEIDSNVCERLYGGMMLYMESWFHMEGPFPRNIRVRGNRLTDIGGPDLGSPDQPAQAAIYVGMVPQGNHLRRSMPLSNIEILGNVIERPAGQPIILSYTQGAKVCDNRILRPHRISGAMGLDVGSRYYGRNLRSAIHVTVCRDVEVRSNTVTDPNGYCTDGPVSLGAGAEDIRTPKSALPTAATTEAGAMSVEAEGLGSAAQPLSFVGTAAPPSSSLTLWWRRPAGGWAGAMPMGNGRLGAMVEGGVDLETIWLNEDTLWSGEPFHPENPNALPSLPEIRKLLLERKEAQAHNLFNQKMLGPYDQCYMPLGCLKFEVPVSGQVEGYSRTLDLSNGVATVSYRQEGVTYTREMFVSHPDQAIVMRLTADRPRRVSFTARLESQLRSQVRGENDILKLKGRCPIHADPHYLGTKVVYDEGPTPKGMTFEADLLGFADDGILRIESGRIAAKACDAVTLVLVAATSYNGFDKSPSREGKDPGALCEAFRKPFGRHPEYDQLRLRHVRDVGALMGRVTLDLGPAADASRCSDERVASRFAPEDLPALTALYYQFGRYLLVSSSRPGTPPANLQGIWNRSVNPPWSANWTMNCNANFNYLGIEAANLSELHEPFIRLVKEWSRDGARTAQTWYGCKGWVGHHNCDLWRNACPVGGNAVWAAFVCGGAWACRDLWEHYSFTLDTAYLRDVWPTVRGACEFFLDYLIEDPKTGFLLTAPDTKALSRNN
jgi:hypothetical protein